MKKLAVLVLLFVTSCSTLDVKRPVSDQDRANIKHIAVIALIDDDFTNQHMGTTVFTNESKNTTVDWHVGDYATNLTKSELEKTGAYKVDAVNLSDAEIKQILKTPGQPQIFDKAKSIGADTVVTLIGSYGVFNKNTFGLSGTLVCSSFTMKTFNVSTQNSLGWKYSYNTLSDGPCIAAKDFTYKENFASYTPTEQANLERTIKNRISEGVTFALKELDLTH